MVYIKMAFNDILSQIKSFIVSVLLIIVCVISITLMVIIYKGQNYGYSSADKLLSNGIESIGFLSLENEEFDNVTIQRFYEVARSREEIETIGDMMVYGIEPISELHNIQKTTEKDFFGVTYGCLDMLVMDVGLYNLCDINLKDGIEPEDIMFEQECEYLYLGHIFENIKVGTEYVTDSGERYVVAGILKEGQRLVNPGLIDGAMNASLDWTIDCDNAIIAVKNSYLTTSGMWIEASDGYSVDEAIVAAFEEAEKYELDFKYTTLQEQYETECNKTINIMSYLKNAFTIIIPAIILMLITMQIVPMLFELNSYGILCAMGFSTNEINVILVIKNLIMSLLAFFVALPIIILMANMFFVEELDKIVNTILYKEALPIAIIVLFVATLVTSITATISLRIYTPVQLLGKRD